MLMDKVWSAMPWLRSQAIKAGLWVVSQLNSLKAGKPTKALYGVAVVEVTLVVAGVTVSIHAAVIGFVSLMAVSVLAGVLAAWAEEQEAKKLVEDNWVYVLPNQTLLSHVAMA
jgi:hypothetical protein